MLNIKLTLLCSKSGILTLIYIKDKLWVLLFCTQYVANLGLADGGPISLILPELLHKYAKFGVSMDFVLSCFIIPCFMPEPFARKGNSSPVFRLLQVGNVVKCISNIPKYHPHLLGPHSRALLHDQCGTLLESSGSVRVVPS
jgi:hypothetical protein